MNQQALTQALSACLLTDEEMNLGVDKWKNFKDTFPVWEIMDDENDEEDDDENDEEDSDEEMTEDNEDDHE